MIPFDINKLQVKHVKIKSVSSAIGGMCSILDETRSTPEKEVFTKVRIPVTVARTFVATYKIKAYIKPVLGCMVTYDGKVIALERHPAGNLGKEETQGLFGMVKWQSQCEQHVQQTLTPLVTDEQWYTDGTYAYKFPDGAIESADKLSECGSFRQVNAATMRLASLALPSFDINERVALGYFIDDDTYTISSPIWKTLNRIGSKQMERATEDESVTHLVVDLHQFDKINETLCVNLAFALKAGRELTDTFGYDAIQPLNLPELMLRLRTVNLPNVAGSVKNTYDIGLPFSHGVAWLLGLLRQVDTLESYMVVRSLLKYLTTRGVYRKGAFDATSILQSGVTFDNVPLKTLEQAAIRE